MAAARPYADRTVSGESSAPADWPCKGAFDGVSARPLRARFPVHRAPIKDVRGRSVPAKPRRGVVGSAPVAGRSAAPAVAVQPLPDPRPPSKQWFRTLHLAGSPEWRTERSAYGRAAAICVHLRRRCSSAVPPLRYAFIRGTSLPLIPTRGCELSRARETTHPSGSQPDIRPHHVCDDGPPDPEARLACAGAGSGRRGATPGIAAQPASGILAAPEPASSGDAGRRTNQSDAEKRPCVP